MIEQLIKEYSDGLNKTLVLKRESYMTETKIGVFNEWSIVPSGYCFLSVIYDDCNVLGTFSKQNTKHLIGFSDDIVRKFDLINCCSFSTNKSDLVLPKSANKDALDRYVEKCLDTVSYNLLNISYGGLSIKFCTPINHCINAYCYDNYGLLDILHFNIFSPQIYSSILPNEFIFRVKKEVFDTLC